MTRPEWVEAGARALAPMYPKDEPPHNRVIDQTRFHATAVIAAVEPLIRADERQRNREAEGVELYLAMEHAEAVAARLVEVICDLDWALHAEVERLRELAKTNFDLFAEAQREKREAASDRDLARAEVAALLASNEGLRQRVDTLVRLHDESLAEVAALRKQEWAAPLRAQIAADIEKVPQYCTFMADGSLDGGDAILRSDAVRIALGES